MIARREIRSNSQGIRSSPEEAILGEPPPSFYTLAQCLQTTLPLVIQVISTIIGLVRSPVQSRPGPRTYTNKEGAEEVCAH